MEGNSAGAKKYGKLFLGLSLCLASTADEPNRKCGSHAMFTLMTVTVLLTSCSDTFCIYPRCGARS
jgi:hypothetical protein